MIKFDLDKNKNLTDREISFIILANKCGKVLAYKDLYPNDIFQIAYRYLNDGCKNRSEYEYLVYTLIYNTDVREELLK